MLVALLHDAGECNMVLPLFDELVQEEDGAVDELMIVPLSPHACSAVEKWPSLSRHVTLPEELSSTYSGPDTTEVLMDELGNSGRTVDVITGLRSFQAAFAERVMKQGGRAIGCRDGCFVGGWAGWESSVQRMSHILTATEGTASEARNLGTEATAVGSISAESWKLSKEAGTASIASEAIKQLLSAAGSQTAEVTKDPTTIVAWAGGYGERYEAAFALFADALALLPNDWVCVVCPHPSARAQKLERRILDSKWATQPTRSRSKVYILGDFPDLDEGISTYEIAMVSSCVGTFDSTVSVSALMCGIPAFHVVPSSVMEAPNRPGESPVAQFVTIAEGLTPACTTPEMVVRTLQAMAADAFSFEPALLDKCMPTGAHKRALEALRGLLAAPR